MGLLDDAIREHLDLKRRRGGDPAEIERAEQEALGPVRRNREAPVDESDDLVAPRGAAVGSAPDELDEGIGAGLVDADEADDDDDLYEDDAFDDEEADVAAHAPEFVEDDHATRVMPAVDIAAPEPRTPSDDVERAFADEDEPFADEPTAEHRVQDVDGDDDVLEETPEFLQDTPDHDRLWFEQRPPRDFDFDG